MSVNNFPLIREILEFRTKDDFYFVQVLQRKKDAKEKGMKVNGTNNNSRLIKPYYIGSLEYFDFVTPEIIQLCEVFNARGCINLNRRSYEKMALQHLRKVTDQIINVDHAKSYKAYPSVCGAYSHESDKTWLLDIDDFDTDDQEIIDFIKDLQPEGDKYIGKIPSKSGYHLMTKPFNVQEFGKRFPEIEVHKNNPTNLYIP